MTRQYDAKALSGARGWIGTIKILLSVRGTVLKDTLLSPGIWIAVGSHLAFLIVGGRIPIMVSNTPLFESGDNSILPVLPLSIAFSTLGLLFFFSVFYVQDCYQRFNQLHAHVVGLGGATQEWALLVRAYSRQEGPGVDRVSVGAMRWNASRYCLAAMHMLFYTLNSAEESGPARISQDEWVMMRARQIITAEEKVQLDAYPGFKPLLALMWSLREAQALVAAWSHAAADRHGDLGQCMRDEHVLSQFREVACRFRAHCGGINGILHNPIRAHTPLASKGLRPYTLQDVALLLLLMLACSCVAQSTIR